MNHRAKIEERDDAKSSSNVVPFRPALGEPTCLGDAVAAVVMNLRYGFPRIQCDRPDGWEMEEDHRGGL